jgi:ComF family protein
MNPYASLAFEIAAAVLAPARCGACDEPVPLMAAFCALCASLIERAPAPKEGAWVAFRYGGPIARAIAKLKYEERPDLARSLGDLLAAVVASQRGALREAVVVPVPLHPSRLVERGYNQAALLASRVARRLSLQKGLTALSRNRDTGHQAALDRRGRARNVAGGFEVRSRRAVEGRSVLLVDDVRTTGATLDACAAALRRAGVAAVAYAVLAQADLDRPA